MVDYMDDPDLGRLRRNTQGDVRGGVVVAVPTVRRDRIRRPTAIATAIRYRSEGRRRAGELGVLLGRIPLRRLLVEVPLGAVVGDVPLGRVGVGVSTGVGVGVSTGVGVGVGVLVSTGVGVVSDGVGVGVVSDGQQQLRGGLGVRLVGPRDELHGGGVEVGRVGGGDVIVAVVVARRVVNAPSSHSSGVGGAHHRRG
eukprot:455852-Pyramimonas_sp.AAC.1